VSGRRRRVAARRPSAAWSATTASKTSSPSRPPSRSRCSSRSSRSRCADSACSPASGWSLAAKPSTTTRSSPGSRGVSAPASASRRARCARVGGGAVRGVAHSAGSGRLRRAGVRRVWAAGEPELPTRPSGGWHPGWMEKQERHGTPRAERHPLVLVANQPRARPHGQFDFGAVSRASKVAGARADLREPGRRGGAGCSGGGHRSRLQRLRRLPGRGRRQRRCSPRCRPALHRRPVRPRPHAWAVSPRRPRRPHPRHRHLTAGPGQHGAARARGAREADRRGGGGDGDCSLRPVPARRPGPQGPTPPNDSAIDVRPLHRLRPAGSPGRWVSCVGSASRSGR
jgi:hypothetical protein